MERIYGNDFFRLKFYTFDTFDGLKSTMKKYIRMFICYLRYEIAKFRSRNNYEFRDEFRDSKFEIRNKNRDSRCEILISTSELFNWKFDSNSIA